MVIPGVEAGVQAANRWAITLSADYGQELIHDAVGYSRFRVEHVFAPAWWIDLGVSGGIYLHERRTMHVDPLVGFTVVARW